MNKEHHSSSFLYEIVIHLENKPISVLELLSEAYDTATIIFCWNKWIKDVEKCLQESITDFSLASKEGMCKAFNECSLQNYLDTAFVYLKMGKMCENPFASYSLMWLITH